MKKMRRIWCMLIGATIMLCACGEQKNNQPVELTVEEKYQNGILLMESGEYEEAKAIFEELGDFDDSKLQMIICDEALVTAEYFAAKELASTGDASAYNEFKSFAKNYEQNVLEGYRKITGADYTTDEGFVEFMEQRESYTYYKSVETEIAYILVDYPELAQKGDHYFYGSYEQDNNLENGKEPIEWVIANKKDGKLKLYAQYVLDSKPYHTEAGKIGWKDCYLRQWLNETFMTEAFSEEERANILVSQNEAYVDVENWNGKMIAKEVKVDDFVYLDGVGEGENGDHMRSSTEATAYAWAQGLEERDGRFCYWMMNPVRTHWGRYWAPAEIGMKIVEANGANTHEEGFGVRPLMWVAVEGVVADEEEQKESKPSGGSFTNKYGTPSTKCAHSGCDNYIASSGDTNACVLHSRSCMECGCFTDEDAMYCMSCLSKAMGTN